MLRAVFKSDSWVHWTYYRTLKGEGENVCEEYRGLCPKHYGLRIVLHCFERKIHSLSVVWSNGFLRYGGLSVLNNFLYGLPTSLLFFLGSTISEIWVVWTSN